MIRVLNKSLFLLSLPVLLYYIINYIIAIFLKSRIGFNNYGEIGIILSYSAFFQSFVMFGLNNGVDNIVFNGKNWNDFFTKTILATILISFISLLIMFLFDIIKETTLLALIHSILFCYYGIYKSQLSAKKNYLRNFYVQITNLSIGSLLTFLAFAYFDNPYLRIIFLIISDLIVIMIYFPTDFILFCKKSFNEIYSTKFTFNEFKFYLFIVLHGIFSFFYSFYDRILIANNTSLADSGKYWFYMQLTTPILVAGEILVRFKIKDIYSSELSDFIEKNKLNLLAFGSAFFTLFIFFIFITKSFFILMIGGQIMNALYLPLSAIIYRIEKTYLIFILTVSIALLQFFIYNNFHLNSLLSFSIVFCLLSSARSLIYFLSIIINNSNFLNVSLKKSL